MSTQKQIEEIRLTMWRYILDKRNHEILREYPYALTNQETRNGRMR